MDSNVFVEQEITKHCKKLQQIISEKFQDSEKFESRRRQLNLMYGPDRP